MFNRRIVLYPLLIIRIGVWCKDPTGGCRGAVSLISTYAYRLYVVKQDSPLLNQYISGLVIPAIREVQNAIFAGDFYACLRAHEVLLPLLWRHDEPLVVKARSAIQGVRNEANAIEGVDTESRLRDYHFRKQVLAETLSIELYYAVMGRINSEGFFELVTTVLGTSGGLSSGSKVLKPIEQELSNKV